MAPFVNLGICAIATSVVTKALVSETEAKTEAPGFEAKTEAESVASETEAKTKVVDPEAKAARQLTGIGYSVPINKI